MEILELPRHRYFVGVQFHPEFKSRPGKPSPLFTGLIDASSGQLNGSSMPQQSPSCNEKKGPVPMKVVSGSTSSGGSGYASGGLEDVGLLGLHVSGAALAH